MMKKIFYALLGLLTACIVLGSCSTEDTAALAISQMFRSSSQAPLFLNCKAVSADEIEFSFSQPVTVKSVSFTPALEVASVEDGSTVRVRLAETPAPGVRFTADLLAEDSGRNTINVIVPFRSRNDRMPSLVINELCTENSSSTKKTEFIELKMKSGGNLGAMRIVIMGNSNASKYTVYEFLPVEVKKGDYVTLHLRTLEETCKNEYGGDIKESGGVNSSELAWDFWIPGSTKLMQTIATTVYVLDQDDRVLDAVMISQNPNSWSRDYFAEAADFLFQQGAWKSADGNICRPADTVNSANATNTRTICRDETVGDSDTAADWYIVYTSSATPGKENNTRRWN
jgi:hypothetical protein